MGTAGRYDRGIEVRLLAFSFVILSLSSCKFNPNFQGKGTPFVQGEWEQEQVPYEDQLLTSTRHRLTFTCDSIYAVLQTRSKVNPYADSCFNTGQWTEYAKGTYLVRHDTLFVFGTFTHETFKQKLTGCYRIGRYLPIFIVKKHTPDSLYLQNLQDHLPVTLALKRKIECVPKPL